MKHVDVLPQLVLDGAGRCHIYFSLASSMPFLEFLQLAPSERRAAAGVWPPAAAFEPWADRAQVPGMRPRVDTTAKTQNGIGLTPKR